MTFAISSVETFVVSIPNRQGPTGLELGGQSWSSVETLLVRLVGDDGTVGWGEGFGFHVSRVTKQALDRLVAPLLLGRALDGPSAWTDQARRKLHNFGMNGPVVFAISAVDIALWDIAAKRAGKPLHELIGARRTRIPAYASLMRHADPAELRRTVVTAIAEGYGQIKLHEARVEQLFAVRAMLDAGQALMTDVNCPWTPEEAVAIAGELEGAGLAWLEEPTWPPNDFEGLARVRRAGATPIAAGENLSGLGDFKGLLAAGAVDIAQPSVTKVGGVTELLRVAALCTEHGVRLAPHSPYFGPGFVATAHILACAAEPIPAEWYYGDMEADLYGFRFKPQAGEIALPDAPGLGADPDMAVVERYQVA